MNTLNLSNTEQRQLVKLSDLRAQLRKKETKRVTLVIRAGAGNTPVYIDITRTAALRAFNVKGRDEEKRCVQVLVIPLIPSTEGVALYVSSWEQVDP